MAGSPSEAKTCTACGSGLAPMPNAVTADFEIWFCVDCGTYHKVRSMDKKVEPAEAIEAEAATVTELRAKLEQLNRREQEVKADKKNAAKTYGDELKDIQDELKELLVSLDQLQRDGTSK